MNEVLYKGENVPSTYSCLKITGSCEKGIDYRNRISLIRRGFSFATKYHSSKMRGFLLVIKTVFPMFVRIAVRFVEVQMPDKGC